MLLRRIELVCVVNERLCAKVQGDSDYVFFFAYIQPPPAEGKPIWSNADELTQVNSKTNPNNGRIYEMCAKRVERGHPRQLPGRIAYRQHQAEAFLASDWC